MRRECRERFSRNCGLAISTCITARAWRTCRDGDACRGRYIVVSFEFGGGEKVPGIPGACDTRKFTYLVRGHGKGWYALNSPHKNDFDWRYDFQIDNIA